VKSVGRPASASASKLPRAAKVPLNRISNVVGTAYGLVALASSAAAVVVPTIRDEFDLSLATGAWVLTAFVVALAASAPI